MIGSCFLSVYVKELLASSRLHPFQFHFDAAYSSNEESFYLKFMLLNDLLELFIECELTFYKCELTFTKFLFAFTKCVLTFIK